MKQTTIPIKPDAKVMVKCSSDLSVEGTDSSTLVVIVDQGDCLRMREENGLFRIQSDTDCRVLLPSSVTVTIEKANGDCHLSNLTGRVIVGKIGSDLKMENLGGASVESVGNDCWIHNATGAIELARVGDDLTVDGVQAILASSVGNDVHLTNFHGKVDVAAGDDVSMHATDPILPEIRAKAGADINLYLPKDAKCQLVLTSGGEEIEIHAGGQDAEMEEHDFSLPIGEGGAIVNLIAGDGINVTDQETPDWEDDKMDWDDDHWEDFGIELARKVREGLTKASESMDHAMRKVEIASRHAGNKVDRAFRKLDERGISVNIGHSPKVVGFSMDSNKTPVNSPKSGPTDEERMLVLKMLQEKKITVEEAEKLLNALDR